MGGTWGTSPELGGGYNVPPAPPVPTVPTPLGCTTGWVNYAHERSQAALERSSQDAYDVIRLRRSKAAVWTADDVARLIEIKKNVYFFTLGSI